jgi:pyruvate/2-oxoglutarate/acetoin dehydrogenase E1 component
METLRDVIKETVRTHLSTGHKAYGQCLTAVGWVGGTLPELYEADGMVELSMADVAGGGFVVGAALAGGRPIYIIRYQGFNWFNAPIVLNYACKSKEMWSRPCPMMIRSIAMEGSIGPVAGSSHHSLYFRMPGVKIFSPMTPNEYKDVYSQFMKDDEVYYISEHRGAYNNSEELEDISYDDPDFVLMPISITRFAAVEAARKLREENSLKVSVVHQYQLKPYLMNAQNQVSKSKFGSLVIDDDYVDGIARSIASRYHEDIGSCKPVYSMGIKDRTAGFAKRYDNLPPTSEEIIEFVRRKCNVQ